MGSVLCVTRGGEGGIRAQKEAVRIATDRGEPLVFLFVADSSFLDRLAAPIVVDIKAILKRMGWLPLHTALERASAESVRAEALTRYGVLSNVLPEAVSQTGASAIVVGHLTGAPSCFERAEMDKLLVSMRE